MWDFSTEPEFQAKLDWMDEFIRTQIEPLDQVLDVNVFESPTGALRDLINSLKQEVRDHDLWACHLDARARRPGLRPAEARADERVARALDVGADHLRLRGARHRQRGDHRRVRHARAEGEVAPAAARRRGVLLLLDDRAARRLRPDAVQVPGRARRRRVGHQRRQVLLVEPAHRVVHHRDVRDESRRAPLPGHVDDPRALRHARDPGAAGHRAPRPAVRRRHARARALRERARSRREPARRRRQGVRGRAAPPRRRSHPPRDAHRRDVPALLRDDVRARAEPHHEGRRCSPRSRWCRNRSRSRGSSSRSSVCSCSTRRGSSTTRARAQVRQYVAACKVRAAQVMSKIGSRATHLHGALGVSNLMPLGGNGEIMATVDGPTEVHIVTVARQVMKSTSRRPTTGRRRSGPRAAREPAPVRGDRGQAARRRRARRARRARAGRARQRRGGQRFEEYLELTANS